MLKQLTAWLFIFSVLTINYSRQPPRDEHADGYFVTDLKINYSKKRHELGLTIENLLNRKRNE